jgi:alkylation response protein AidB-like acyl-CoA dehydrogenase
MLAGFAEYRGHIIGIVVPADVESELTRRPVSVGALPGVEFCRLELEIAPEHLVGTERAEPAFLQIASDHWLLVSAVILGIARASLAYILDYSRRRTTFGKPICQHQAVSLRLADIMIALESASLLCRDMCQGADGERSNFEAAQGCWRYVREMAVTLGPEMLQLMGGHGFLRMHPVEQWYRDLQFLCLYGDLPEAIEEEL